MVAEGSNNGQATTQLLPARTPALLPPLCSPSSAALLINRSSAGGCCGGGVAAKPGQQLTLLPMACQCINVTIWYHDMASQYGIMIWYHDTVS